MASFKIKSQDEIRGDILRTYYNGLLNIGVTQPNVSPGSDTYVLATAVANEISAAQANMIVQVDAAMPDTAIGEDLDRLLDKYGLSRRPASQSTGFVRIVTSTSTLVVTGAELLSATGVRFQVVTGGTFANNADIQVESIDSGTTANFEVNEVFTWVIPPAFAQSTCLVSQAITGGAESEDDETARTRLLSRIQNPPQYGNWQNVSDYTEAADPVIQKAFIYSAANGPGTQHVAVVGYPSDVSKSRQIATSKLTDIINFVKGNAPEYVETVVTGVTDVSTNVSFKMTLPLAPTAAIPGSGGGWINGQPFPYIDVDAATVSATKYYAGVTSVSSATSFTIRMVITDEDVIQPELNVSQISWIDKSDWKIKTGTILTSSLTSTDMTGYWTHDFAITIDNPFTKNDGTGNIAVNDWVFPAMTNGQIYLDAVLTGFYFMGPGEKTNATSVLPRAYRKPRPTTSFPFSLDSSMLKYIINSGDEVLTADYYYRSTTTPALPAAISSAPNILIPGHLGFYPPNPITS